MEDKGELKEEDMVLDKRNQAGNTILKKEHLVTLKSGSKSIQIDFFSRQGQND